MIVKMMKIDSGHWSVDWIPISYKLTDKQMRESLVFLWSENEIVNAMCRCYYISKTRVELGDLWINEAYRGKTYRDGLNYSLVFLKRVISKIWRAYPCAKAITLVVAQDNVRAIKLYDRLHFDIVKRVDVPSLNIKNGVLMRRTKIA